jgi:hypothetical protein
MHIVRPSNRYSGARVNEVGEISAALKGLAKELDVPIIALAQLSRQDAKKAFAKAINSGTITPDALMAKTRSFAASWQNEPKDRRKFIPYPASWLNAGGYDDEPDGGDGAEPAAVVRDPRSFTDADWQKRLTHLQDSEAWLPSWGPKPGESGCLVPSRLIVTPVSTSQGAA